MALVNLPFLGIVDTMHGIVSVLLNPLNHMYAFTFFVTLFVSGLTGMHVVLLPYIRKYRKEKISRKINPSGIVSTVFVSLGMGCASCGSIVLLTVLTSLGFGVSVWFASVISNILMSFAVLVLLCANYKLYKQAKNPLVCSI